MSVISTNLQSPATRDVASSQELLSRSLLRLASSPIANSSSAADGVVGADNVDPQSRAVQAATADIQNALTSGQTAAGYLDSLKDILSKMSDLAGQAQNDSSDPAALAKDQQQFAALQDQLRSIIGGSTSEIGGTTDVNPPTGSFNGTALFGPDQAGTSGPTDLRQGSMLALIGQDSTGAYNLNLSDSDASADIAGALQQVAGGSSAVSASQAKLEVAAAKLQIEQQNLFSAFSPINDSDSAEQSTQFAQDNILGQSGTALLAQNGQTSAAVLNLLQN